MEDFYTIQGEGSHQGRAAYFIRLGGCEVRCVWCDVKDSWNVNDHPKVSVESIATKAKSSGTEICVVTGGEPTMHNLEALTRALKVLGLKTHLETSGAYPITGTWDWICFSPKKFKHPHPSVAQQASELKVVVFHKSDFAWAEEFANQVRPECKLYLQPEWSKEDEILPQLIDYVKKNPRWQISLQVHKYMNIP
ncbi:MAG: 7-carboxy-7-deazaguanine synthase QueE [Cyclobacteriaceae bacterium]|nr:7-carboxy-7-deazaguanine synthase QueE [Cyclobacteriaceae bacterium]